MRSYVYLQVDDLSNDTLLDKIAELGYIAVGIHRSDSVHVYMVEMNIEDLVILKLTVPLVEVHDIGCIEGNLNE